MLESFYLKQEKILEKAINYFQNSSFQETFFRHCESCESKARQSMTIKIGLELEFFLFDLEKKPADEIAINNFILEFKKNCNLEIEKERGISQIEVKTDFSDDLISLCTEIENCKKLIAEISKKQNLITNFQTKPIQGDCPSALQFNISLHNNNDENLFLTQKKLIKNFSNSLLAKTNEILAILAPTKECFARFDLEENINLFKVGKFTSPVNLSFGFDNRTCAIRLKNNRLEYRAASSMANPFLSIAAILLILSENSQENFTEIFGNAFDEKYQLKPILTKQEEAIEMFNLEENFVRKFFQSC
jgi:glutamine synthetase